MNKKTFSKSAAREIIFLAISKKITTKNELSKIKNAVLRKYRENTFPDAELLKTFWEMKRTGEIAAPDDFAALFQKRKIRTLSGIAPISVLMPPAPCHSACVYCPTERANAAGKTLFQIDTEKKYGAQKLPKKFQKSGAIVMPKSYLSSEPGAMRAILAGFDPFVQISRRLAALEKIGHSPEKCELIIQGGTFSDLPHRARNAFVKRCFQAFNQNLARKTLAEIQKENETAKYRVVGLTLETRPGCVNEKEIREFRRLGATRIELGVQTLDDEITKKTRRRQTRAEVVRATRLLRDAGFKICYHMMPGLPFSTPEIDLKNYAEIFENPDFRPDLVKVYPCSVVPFSELQKWFDEKKYTPYPYPVLHKLLKKILLMTPRWVRISRFVRDIPSTAILGGAKKTNFRQLLENEIFAEKKKISEIRAREIRDEKIDFEKVFLKKTKYSAAGGTEFFLEMVDKNDKICAMLRLRLPPKNQKTIFRALKNAAIIRELHTFGAALRVDEKSKKIQHAGFGKTLLAAAERIARENNFKKIAVISGIGVKNFYRKRGFFDDGLYLTKKI